MTICIAAICNTTQSPVVLFCADRLVSAGIQFEGGSSKVIHVTKNVTIMESSNDSAYSEMVLEGLRSKITQTQQYTTKQITEILSKECIDRRKAKLEENVVYRYNLAVNNLKADANVILRDVVNELRIFPYPQFDFIVAGLDNPKEAHIFTVDQDGNVKSWDFLGFTTIGSGSELAFSEMTKWYYEDRQPLTLAIPRIYFAKKAAERAQGVGRYTDYGFIGFIQTSDNKLEPNPFFISSDVNLMKLLDDAHKSIGDSEAATINKTMEMIQSLFEAKQKERTEEQKPDLDKKS